MYSQKHLQRVQDYILRNPGTSFYVFHNPADTPPQLAGDYLGTIVTLRTSPYVQRGALLVLDQDGIHAGLVSRLMYDDLSDIPVQHQLFTANDLQGLAAREAQQ